MGSDSQNNVFQHLIVSQVEMNQYTNRPWARQWSEKTESGALYGLSDPVEPTGRDREKEKERKERRVRRDTERKRRAHTRKIGRSAQCGRTKLFSHTAKNFCAPTNPFGFLNKPVVFWAAPKTMR
jgi:hypothetical protein